MNIKKLYIVLISICICIALSVSVYADVNIDDYLYFADDGSLQYDMDAYYYAYACDLVSHSGVDIDPSDYWIISLFSGECIGYNYNAFRTDYDNAIAELSPEPILSTSGSESLEVDLDDNVVSTDSQIEEITNYDVPIESEDISVSDILETDENNTELESGEDSSMVYLVNDLRSSYVSSLSYSLRSTDSDLTFEDIWGSSSFHSVSNITTVDSVFFVQYNNGNWSVGFTRETPDINIEKKYIYFPTSNIYLDSHWTVHKTEPTYSIGNSYNSIWGEHEHNIGNAIFDAEHDIDQIFLYPDATYNYCPYGSGAMIWETNKTITVNLDKRYLFLPDINVYITDNWEISYTEPFNDNLNEGDLTGTLKELIVSIFGEYEPVLTAATVTETVDNVTTTTIIDAVASGAAGVDWEWCAGVFLFGIMIFCLFKLLGGILS